MKLIFFLLAGLVAFAGCDDTTEAPRLVDHQVATTGALTTLEPAEAIAELASLAHTQVEEALGAHALEAPHHEAWLWFTPAEGQYSIETVASVDGCGEVNVGPGDPPNSDLPFSVPQPTITNASSAGFDYAFTLPGQFEPLPGAPGARHCELHGLVFKCETQLLETAGDLPIFPALLGQTFDAVYTQSTEEAGIFIAGDRFLRVVVTTNSCTGPDCEAFLVAGETLFGVPWGESVECSPSRALTKHVLELPLPAEEG